MAETLTLETAEASLSAWIQADRAVAQGQAYSIGGRSLTRANAGEITKKIIFWQNQVNSLTNVGGVTVRRVLPRDL